MEIITTFRGFGLSRALGAALLALSCAWTPAIAATPVVLAGTSHSCSLSVTGGVKCWGLNSFGQIGDTTTTSPRLAPTDVSGLTSGAKGLAVGANFTCAITSSNGVRCWGQNNEGQLGINAFDSGAHPTPADIAGLSNVIAIAAGQAHACAVLGGGGVKCWGSNGSARLGDGSVAVRQVTPVDVSGLTGATAVAAGAEHTCAIVGLGGLKCWGNNSDGRLGDGTTTSPRPAPVDVSTLASDVSAVAAGGTHSCAVKADGSAFCWGNNANGRLGNNSTTNSSVPVAVDGLAGGVTAIAAGATFSCAVASGGLKCWGFNDVGQLGDNTTDQRLTPVDVSGFTSGAQTVAAGLSHACALTTNGTLKCWGNNPSGQLGDNMLPQRLTPVDVPGLTSGMAAVSAGTSHTCALSNAGGLKCWGRGLAGELGHGAFANSLYPVDVSGLTSGIGAVAAGFLHTCAITTGGGAKCWGQNGFGQVGDGSSGNFRNTPVDVTGLSSGVTSIASGNNHSCAVVSGGVYCWGSNAFGQLGQGAADGTAHPNPLSVPTLTSGVQSVVTGDLHTCALLNDGSVKCWGINDRGQMGDTTGTTPRPAPVDVSTLSSGVAAITAGSSHTCARIAGAGVKCWGWNVVGQIGDNSIINRTAPVDVNTLTSGVTLEATAQFHSCAVTSTPEVFCWGTNSNGGLGDNTTTQRLVPVTVSGLTSGVTSMAGGQLHTCAVVDGGVKCWGLGSLGQLGDGTGSFHPYTNVVFGLNLFTVPDAPTIGTGTPGNGTATIEFFEPVFNGGTPVTGYTLTCNPGGLSVSGADSPLTVTGLANDTMYTCSVTADNIIGTSAASGTVDVTPAAVVPDAPAIGTATAGNTTATVTFAAPPSDGGSAITGYSVTSDPAGGVDSNAGSTGLSHVINLLANGTAYTFTVTATNAVGTGPPSAASNSVTPSGPTGTVTVTLAGSGEGLVTSTDTAIDCGMICAHAYANGSVVTLNAAPSPGSIFSGWLGACTGLGPCSLNISSAANVSATFAPDTVQLRIDVDGNGSYDPETDGLLMLRYLFELTGTALTSGAIGPGMPTRSMPAEILEFLNNIRPLLDVDGNGQPDALTDGLLIIRHLFGLSGPALVIGAIGDGATRTTEQIETYLQGLVQ